MSEHDPQWDPAAEHEAADRFEELIRRRAFEMSEADNAGTAEYNWLRAERELRELIASRAGEELPG